MRIERNKRISAAVAGLVCIFLSSQLLAQENESTRIQEATENESQVELERSQLELPDYDATGSNKSATPDVVVEIEAKINELEQQPKLTTKERASLLHLRKELKQAKVIRQQFKRAKPAKGDRAEDDTYVVAKLEVQPSANILDVRFESIEGEGDSVRNMVEYVGQTPGNGFRDFRIVSRHSSGSDADSALYQVRQDYDLAKQQQEQYLRYIAQQQAALSRIAAARRC
ncbi:MAG: hypothetical protein Q8M16_08720 [Pirellulaceae bacterium]|nr:hypothetical protein [Pirellulaceae bacterium]